MSTRPVVGELLEAFSRAILPVALASRSEQVAAARALLERWRKGCIVRAKLAEREARTRESWAGLALAGTEFPHVMLARRHRAEARRYRDQAGVIDDMFVKLLDLEGEGVVIMDELLRWVESDAGDSDMEASVLKLSAGMKPLTEEPDLDGPEPEVARAAAPQAKLSDLQRAVAAAEADPQVSALLGAEGSAERRERALASPELKPPHPYFSALVNDVLTFVYFEGLSHEETAGRIGISPSAVAGMATRALRFLALYRQDPKLADRRTSRLLDPLHNFDQARSAVERRYAARRHPEVRALFGKLCEREAAVLHGLYWEGKTLQEVGRGLGLTKERVRQLGNKALRKLNYFFKLEQRRVADQARVDEVRQVLRDTDTLEQAAEALSFTPYELLAYLARMDLPPSDAPSPGDDPRVEALRAARTAPTRLRVARLYPELRPPHVFLSGDENRALERLYWRGLGYAEAARNDADRWLVWTSVARLKELEVSALGKLACYLRYHDVSYYRLTNEEHTR